jgi:uncharacterized oxidoreductase
VTDEFPSLNVLVNNAGVQVRSGLSADRVWNDFRNEIAINLEAPIHMSLLLLDQFRRVGDSAIINVSSGLAFAPMALAPVYCATKAALHSFTLSLRYEVSGSGVRVVELIPPAVNTDLGGTGLHTRGAPLEEFADVVYSKLKRGDLEIGHGFSDQARLASRQQLDEMFDRMNPPR